MSLLWSLIAAPLQAATPAEVSQWILAQPAPAGQATELIGGGVDAEYARAMPRWVRGQLSRQAALAVASFREGCAEGSRLKVLSPGFAGLGHTEARGRFESSVFKLETTGCLDIADMATAEQTYNSAAFRTAEMPNLSSLQQRGDELCLRSDAVTGIMSATDFCMRSAQLRGEGLVVTHNALHSNDTAAGAAPVWYREEVIIFAQLDGQVGIYRMIWTRGEDIGVAGRAILQRTASGSQSRIYRSLEAWTRR